MPFRKSRKTAPELEDMINRRLGDGRIRFVRVTADKMLGWYAIVVVNPKRVADLQVRAEKIATQLRLEFELKV